MGVADWLKNRVQAIKEVFEFDFWEWLLLTNQGRTRALTAITAVLSFVGQYISPKWQYGAVGGLVTSLLIFGPSLFSKKREGVIDRRAEEVATPVEIARIGFDYLPASPTNNGWKVGYPKRHPIPADAAWMAAPNSPTAGGMTMELSDVIFAMDYNIPANAALSTRFICDFKFSNTAMLFIQVKLATRDESDKRTGWLKFELGIGQPHFNKEYTEWVLPISPQASGNGWYHLDLPLVDSVARTWEREGWCLIGLLTIRLRGHLRISPIKLCE